MTTQAKPERIGVRAVAMITGMSVRVLQERAARGLVPSAAKLGGTWSFNENTIRRWIRNQERETAKSQRIYIASARRGTAGSRLTESHIERAYEQLFTPKRKRRR